jgi:chromatin segregation and condensation protein Rec8/ScpA/Scc1 (kleisin family)
VTDLRPSVTLDVFSGPLDLLLYLVHNHELDPRTVPVSEIADQYLAFLEQAQEAQLGIAGEYLVMAAKLLALKARELLPREERGELEPEEFDGFDREELVRQLLEYRRFKQAAEKLRGLESRTWGAYVRGLSDIQGDRPQQDDDSSLDVGAIGLFDLLVAFRRVLSVRPRTLVHEIEIDDIPIQERMNRIRAHLVREGRAHFEELYPHDGRRLLPVVTFMAILELVKTEELAFRQAGVLRPMVVYRRSDERNADDLARMEQAFDPDPVFNPDVAGLLAEKERMRMEAIAREEALWGGGLDDETGEMLPGPVPPGEDEPAVVSEDAGSIETAAVAQEEPTQDETEPAIGEPV